MTQPNPSRSTKLHDLAQIQQLLRDREEMPQLERGRRRLLELREFVRQLQATEIGQADLARRRAQFGDCTQLPDETDADFYGRLRTWLDHGT